MNPALRVFLIVFKMGVGILLLLLTFLPTIAFDLMHAIGLYGQKGMMRVNNWIEKKFE